MTSTTDKQANSRQDLPGRATFRIHHRPNPDQDALSFCRTGTVATERPETGARANRLFPDRQTPMVDPHRQLPGSLWQRDSTRVAGHDAAPAAGTARGSHARGFPVSDTRPSRPCRCYAADAASEEYDQVHARTPPQRIRDDRSP